MVGKELKKLEIGISVYPDFLTKEEIFQQVDVAAKLGYTRIFTSVQLGNLGFDAGKNEITEEFFYLFSLAKQYGMVVHADINDIVLESMGGTFSNLKPISDLGVEVVRIDGGFTDEQIAIMTHNPYGIMIEDNSSMFATATTRLDLIKEKGNMAQFMACHNFFPRNNTGLLFDDAVDYALLYQSYGCKNGIFIGSQLNRPHLNATGEGVCTVEEHRFTPAHIALMELRHTEAFDIIFFGDSMVDESVLAKVAHCAFSPVTELPVWLDEDVNPELKKALTTQVFYSRYDQPEQLVRMTQTRKIASFKPGNIVARNYLSITVDNELSNRYEGEVQIMLEDLPATRIANVIGQVKPVAARLVNDVTYGQIPFRLIIE